MNHLPSKELGYAIAGVVLVCALYAGSYAALLDGREKELAGGWEVVPKYRYGGDVSRMVFGTVHRVDRLVRPAAWLPEKREVEPLEVLPMRDLAE